MAKNRQNKGKVKSTKPTFKVGDYVWTYNSSVWELIVSINQKSALLRSPAGALSREPIENLKPYSGLKGW